MFYKKSITNEIITCKEIDVLRKTFYVLLYYINFHILDSQKCYTYDVKHMSYVTTSESNKSLKSFHFKPLQNSE